MPSRLWVWMCGAQRFALVGVGVDDGDGEDHGDANKGERWGEGEGGWTREEEGNFIPGGRVLMARGLGLIVIFILGPEAGGAQ